jgi:crotonobetainyl-CoA:carnitine CoA-transferase CaiB-like acyl-CoA transferase
VGYSYLDWFGAYNMTTAIMAGLYRQRVTGEGCWIDASQVEAGMYLGGSAILDFSANGRQWSRYGNGSPYKRAAPHGAYPVSGDDRWIAIACFTEEEWRGFADVMGQPSWAREAKFSTLSDRMARQAELDRCVSVETEKWEPYELMARLQRAGVPAGVCQTAQDRCEVDPQLQYLDWLVELDQSEIGTWPVKEFPVKLTETPAYMGGVVDRHGPNYAEDNQYVYGEMLGLTSRQIRELEDADVI